MPTKWATLYKYVPLSRVSDILDNHRLYLSDGSNFNDPFELSVTSRENQNIRFIQGLHILSLTNSYRNKLIWSHYSDSHKGVCLTVKVPKELVHPICYSAHRVFEDSNIDEVLAFGVHNSKRNVDVDYSALSTDKKIAYIKDKKWSYEKEYRVVFDHNDENSLIFENDKWFMSVKITNIYLGVNFHRNDNKVQNEIIEACNRNNVRISQMILSSSDYSLKVRR